MLKVILCIVLLPIALISVCFTIGILMGVGKALNEYFASLRD
jgi:hypothetical protein